MRGRNRVHSGIWAFITTKSHQAERYRTEHRALLGLMENYPLHVLLQE